MKEIWKPVEGYDGYYVSNYGRVMSMKRKRPLIMQIGRNRLGYATAMFWNTEKRRLDIVHLARVVLAAFNGYPADPWLCYAHQKDGNQLNCKLDNLEWLICETTEDYDPKKSHRRGVLKPRETKEKMYKTRFDEEYKTKHYVEIDGSDFDIEAINEINKARQEMRKINRGRK